MFDSMFPSHWTTLRKLMWLKLKGASAVWSTITGNPVSFTAKAAPLRQLSVAFSPVQSGSGDPSPDNVRPISGWSSLTVEQRGKNLFGGTPKNGRVNFPTVAGRAYTASAQKADPSVDTYCYVERAVAGTEDFSLVGRIIAGRNTNPVTFTAEAGYAYSIYCNSSYTNVKELQIELGSTATAYTPYNPSSRSISITLGETVYSGTVDVISGVGEIDYKLINARDVLWSSSGNVVYTHPNDLYTKITEETPTGRKPLYCNAIKYSANASLAGGGIGYGGINNNGNITVLMTSPWATSEEWTAYIANNDVFICYPLATPIPIQLTPQEVQSLLGVNNMWASSNGDMTVTYRSN